MIYFFFPLGLIFGFLHGDLFLSPWIEQKIIDFNPIISLDEHCENSLYFISKGDLLGKGSFKEVYEISMPHLSSPIALIQPYLKATDKIKCDLKRELAIQAFLAQQMVPEEYLPSFLKGLKQPRRPLTPQVFLVSLSQSGQSKLLFNFAVVEQMEITLEKWAKSNVPTLSQTLNYCLELVNLLLELHEVGLAHGDFHTKNIAFDYFGKLRLIDLGASGLGMPEQRTTNDLPEDTGWDENPAVYFAPEIRKPLQDAFYKGWMSRTSFASDVYSCSYVICEMIIGPELFLEIDKNDRKQAQLNHMEFVFNDGETLEQKLQNQLSPNSSIIRLLADAFSINVVDRPSMKELQLGLCHEILSTSQKLRSSQM